MAENQLSASDHLTSSSSSSLSSELTRARSISPNQTDYICPQHAAENALPKSASQNLLRPYNGGGRRYTEIADHTWTYVSEQNAGTPIVGYGKVHIPSYNSIAQMGQDRSIVLRCFTWNINDKTVKILKKIVDFLAEMDQETMGDIICLSLQEIPPASGNFHEDALAILGGVMSPTHEPFISHRSWSQMMIMFIRKQHFRYSTEPKVKFVPAAAFAKPVRTKGGIGVCFRLYQRWIVIIGCHLSHASMQQRIQDYHKLVRSFKFPDLRNFTGMDHIFAADIVVWTGDLNFRIDTDHGIQWNGNWATRKEDIAKAMQSDGLTTVRQKALAFMDFEEPEISFQPTHKYEVESEEYVAKRVPSYTDRVLYYCRQPDWVNILEYDAIQGATQSDHRPVFCTIRLNVINKPIPQRYYSGDVANGSIEIDPNQSKLERSNTQPKLPNVANGRSVN